MNDMVFIYNFEFLFRIFFHIQNYLVISSKCLGIVVNVFLQCNLTLNTQEKRFYVAHKVKYRVVEEVV